MASTSVTSTVPARPEENELSSGYFDPTQVALEATPFQDELPNLSDV